MKRRPLRAIGGLGLSAICICLSTIVLQTLTTPSPTFFSSFFASLNPVDAFLWNRMTSASVHPEMSSSVDFQLHNLSVHHVRYVDKDVTAKEETQMPPTNAIAGVGKLLMDLLTITTTRRHSTQMSSVVVTWEDHPLATHARAKNAQLETEEINNEPDDVAVEFRSETYSYEVQIWVTGWGLDGLWNAANRKVLSYDPFLVLEDLPLERELGFRVRMKAQQTKMSVLGRILPMGFFSTETDGEWTEVVTLSPTTDDELQALVTSLADNKLLVVLLAVCIGSGCLVVVQQYVRPVYVAVTRKRKMQLSRRLPIANENTVTEASRAAASGDSNEDSDKSMQELKHEIHDLRQELADSEDEVRQLMLLSGYGMETLLPHELEQLERELKYTLKRIQYLKKHGLTSPKTSNSIKGQLSGNESSRRGERRRHKERDDPY